MLTINWLIINTDLVLGLFLSVVVFTHDYLSKRGRRNDVLAMH